MTMHHGFGFSFTDVPQQQQQSQQNLAPRGVSRQMQHHRVPFGRGQVRVRGHVRAPPGARFIGRH